MQRREEHVRGSLLSDETKMVFITAGMGGGTGTGAGPVVAGVAKDMGMLTIGVVTIPFYFEKEKKIIKALKGVEEMRKNVDALLIVNNERLCDVYSNTRISVKDAFKCADAILGNAVKSISELITIEGDINLDFCDVESTMKSGGGAIMAIGRAGGEHRVEKAIINALDSPLLYGCDISKAKRILFNIYTSPDSPLFVDELQEIDAFMDELSPQIEVIWGVSDDNSLGEDAKIAILATGLDDDNDDFGRIDDGRHDDDADHYRSLIKKLYSTSCGKADTNRQEAADIPLTVQTANGDGIPGIVVPVSAEKSVEEPAGDPEEAGEEPGYMGSDTATAADGGVEQPVEEPLPGMVETPFVTPKEPPVPPVQPLVERLKKIWDKFLKE